MNLKAQLKEVWFPEICFITLFALAGYTSGNIRFNPSKEVPLLMFLILGCFFLASQILKSFLQIPKQDLMLKKKILALVAMVMMLTPPFVCYGQGWNPFIATSLMFCLVAGFSFTNSWWLKKIKNLPGLDLIVHSLTWGCLSMSVGVLFSGLEPETRSWLIVLLGFYLFASYSLVVKMNGSETIEEKPSLIMYLGESRTLELIAILQLFGVIGLTTLYLSEYESLNAISFTFYVLFTLIALVSVFKTLVWSKQPTFKKRFNYLFFLITNNLYLLCWVVAEWFYQ